MRYDVVNKWIEKIHLQIDIHALTVRPVKVRLVFCKLQPLLAYNLILVSSCKNVVHMCNYFLIPTPIAS